MEQSLVKRIHVGGLTDKITASHLKDRFNSFGKVLDIDPIGLNAMGEYMSLTGQPRLMLMYCIFSIGDVRPFTFLTVETTAPQWKKCAFDGDTSLIEDLHG